MSVKQFGIVAPYRQLSRDYFQKNEGEKTSPASAQVRPLIAVVNVRWRCTARRNTMCLFGMISGSHQHASRQVGCAGGHVTASECFAHRQITLHRGRPPYMALPDMGADT